MKKTYLFSGIIYSVVGLICFAVATFTNTRLESLLFGLGGAGFGSGVGLVVRYFYSNSPKHRDEYQARVQQEQIELRDERKTMLRDKSGRYAYIVGLAITALAIVVFGVLGALDVAVSYRVIVLFLGAFLIFQYIIGIVIFRLLGKKY